MLEKSDEVQFAKYKIQKSTFIDSYDILNQKANQVFNLRNKLNFNLCLF